MVRCTPAVWAISATVCSLLPSGPVAWYMRRTGQMTRENPGRGYKPIQGELKPPQSLARQFT